MFPLSCESGVSPTCQLFMKYKQPCFKLYVTKPLGNSIHLSVVLFYDIEELSEHTKEHFHQNNLFENLKCFSLDDNNIHNMII